MSTAVGRDHAHDACTALRALSRLNKHCRLLLLMHHNLPWLLLLRLVCPWGGHPPTSAAKVA